MKGQAADQQRDWLILLNAPSFGGASLINTIEAFGSAAAVAGATARELSRYGLSEETVVGITRPDQQIIERSLQWLSHERHHLLCWDNEDFPALLRGIPSPPAALYIDGDPGCLWQPQIAVIGSRNPTAGGLEHAHDFASTLARMGMTITSGLASGIDTAAHRAALGAGAQTIAVNGTGLDTIYPASSRAVGEQIPLQGAMVSELPLAAKALRQHFPSRNRIISGLSLAVLVIEAGLNSGTLITARKAAEQGRDVFALPGSLNNPMAKGCHRLIRDGARLVETAADILQELGPVAAQLKMEIQQRLDLPDKNGSQTLSQTAVTAPSGDKELSLLDDPDYSAIWDVLGFDPKPVDSIIEQTGLKAREVSSMLLMLELKGMIKKSANGRFFRA
jgi:DNA processing protein